MTLQQSDNPDASPVEQAIRLSQQELCNAYTSVIHVDEDNDNIGQLQQQQLQQEEEGEENNLKNNANEKATDLLPNENAFIEDDNMLSDNVELHHDFNYYYNHHHRQPKNEIPYSDWMYLFPNLDLINGNFTCSSDESMSTLRRTSGEEDAVAINNIDQSNQIQIPDEFNEVIECRNKLKKLIMEKLLDDASKLKSKSVSETTRII